MSMNVSSGTNLGTDGRTFLIADTGDVLFNGEQKTIIWCEKKLN